MSTLRRICDTRFLEIFLMGGVTALLLGVSSLDARLEPLRLFSLAPLMAWSMIADRRDWIKSSLAAGISIALFLPCSAGTPAGIFLGRIVLLCALMTSLSVLSSRLVMRKPLDLFLFAIGLLPIELVLFQLCVSSTAAPTGLIDTLVLIRYGSFAGFFLVTILAVLIHSLVLAAAIWLAFLSSSSIACLHDEARGAYLRFEFRIPAYSYFLTTRKCRAPPLCPAHG